MSETGDLWRTLLKLLYCPICEDIKKLNFYIRYCECGESWGLYNSDGEKACIGGMTKLVGVGNGDLFLMLSEAKATCDVWWYHSSWWSERMTDNVYYVEKEEDFSYSVFEKKGK
jgi:hypothetical protein